MVNLKTKMSMTMMVVAMISGAFAPSSGAPESLSGGASASAAASAFEPDPEQLPSLIEVALAPAKLSSAKLRSALEQREERIMGQIRAGIEALSKQMDVLSDTVACEERDMEEGEFGHTRLLSSALDGFLEKFRNLPKLPEQGLGSIFVECSTELKTYYSDSRMITLCVLPASEKKGATALFLSTKEHYQSAKLLRGLVTMLEIINSEQRIGNRIEFMKMMIKVLSKNMPLVRPIEAQ